MNKLLAEIFLHSPQVKNSISIEGLLKKIFPESFLLLPIKVVGIKKIVGIFLLFKISHILIRMIIQYQQGQLWSR